LHNKPKAEKSAYLLMHTMKRFIILDEFGEPIRRFATKAEAVNFMRNKNGCTLIEISLDSILGDCLF
jgi:hypothetical protein